MKTTVRFVLALFGLIALCIGNASAQVPAIDTCIHPETLNLKSKGRWVTGEINLPGGSEVVPDTVRITRIEIPSENIDVPVNIPMVPNTPLRICRDDDTVELQVKFPRYDKADPASLQSLVGQLASLLSGSQKGRYRAIVTIEGEFVNGGTFIGVEDDFNVTKPKPSAK